MIHLALYHKREMCIIGSGCFSHLNPSYTGPSHNWSWDRVGHRDHVTTVKTEELSGFLVYPTPVTKKGNIPLQDTLGFTCLTLVPVLRCSGQNVTTLDSKACPRTLVTSELKGTLSYSQPLADHAALGSDKSFCRPVYWDKFIQ